MHLNLPFADDAQFGAHHATHVPCPPAGAPASKSPIRERAGRLDGRHESARGARAR
jgi:hypothetical protein